MKFNIKKNSVIANILFYLIFVLIVSGGIFLKNLGELDEVWNYNAARCIQDGLLPYRDISIITIPLFPLICSVFLKFLGNELIVMRTLSCFLFGGIFFTIYKILRKLKINQGISFVLVIRNYMVLYNIKYFCF